MHTFYNTRPRYLLAFDFDGTLFDTFAPSPQGVGINEAYERAVKDLFGEEGINIYKTEGGLQNRSPFEVVSSLYAKGNRDTLTDNASNYYKYNNDAISHLVPEGKGIPFKGNKVLTLAEITELFVRVKLSYLQDQIGLHSQTGEMWPVPMRGLIDFWRTIDELRLFEGIGIDIAVISSGHDRFIKKTFDVWKLSPPDFLVTDDDMRGMDRPEQSRLRVKPGPVPLTLAYQKWLQLQGKDGLDQRIYFPLEANKRMIYFGDDAKKDGGLASVGALPFGLYDANGLNSPPINGFVFSDWGNIAGILQMNSWGLRQGISLKEIFTSNNIGGYEKSKIVRDSQEHVRREVAF